MTDTDYDATTARGRQQGQLVARFAPWEREAWLRGLTEVLGPLPAGGLVAAPAGLAWAESGHHQLVGSQGLVHLIRVQQLDLGGRQVFRWDGTAAVCGLEATLWTTIGAGDPSRREPCPTCAGTRTRG